MTLSHVPDFLSHDEADSVAVATRDLAPGQAEGGYLVGTDSLTVELVEPIPLGHKFALRPIGAGEGVIEYGVRIAVASEQIAAGERVHVHNVRSVRWQSSVAS